MHSLIHRDIELDGPEAECAELVGHVRAHATARGADFVRFSRSEAERLAFYRAALVRNLLVRAGIPPATIATQIRVTDPMSKDGHNVRVVLKP